MIKLINDTIDRNDIDALCAWLQQDPIPQLTKGPLTMELEQKWADKIGTKFSVFVNSGSSAILLGLTALLHSNKLYNKKIVIPGLAWATDLSIPMILGFTPILCDCNLTDLSLDLEHLERIFAMDSPSCCILVSVLGLVPQMDKIIELCEAYGVVLLEDVCESTGSKYKDKYLGSFGLASFFSFYYGHHLSTIEGGFVNTDNEELYHLMLMARSHGWSRDLPLTKQEELMVSSNTDAFNAMYNFYVPGFNLRSTDLQAFIGLRQLDKMDMVCTARNKNFEAYDKLMTSSMLRLVRQPDCFVSSLGFPVCHINRVNIVRELQDMGIEVRPLIAGDISKKPLWLNVYDKVYLPNCDVVNTYGFYLPNHSDLSSDNIRQIAAIINLT